MCSCSSKTYSGNEPFLHRKLTERKAKKNRNSVHYQNDEVQEPVGSHNDTLGHDVNNILRIKKST